MRCRSFVWLGVAWACACRPPFEGYPPICEDASAGCVTTNPHPDTTGSGGGDGGSDRVVPDAGEAGVLTVVSVQSVFSVSTTLPVGGPPSAPAPQDGWLITAVDAPEIPAVTTADGGTFSLSSVPVVGGACRLSAMPPPGAGILRALFEWVPAAAVEHEPFVSVSPEALRSAASAGLTTLDETAAHLIVQLVGAPDRIAGLTVALLDAAGHPISGVTPLYDVTGASYSSAAIVTGSHGLALFLNLASASAGTPLIVRVARAAVVSEDPVTVYPNHSVWLPMTAP